MRMRRTTNELPENDGIHRMSQDLGDVPKEPTVILLVLHDLPTLYYSVEGTTGG